MKNVDKAIGFLDFMVQAVFVSTFIFTIVMGIFVMPGMSKMRTTFQHGVKQN